MTPNHGGMDTEWGQEAEELGTDSTTPDDRHTVAVQGTPGPGSPSAGRRSQLHVPVAGQEDGQRVLGHRLRRLAFSGRPNATVRDESDTIAAAVAAYRASLQTGRPLSERKLAGMFGKTSRRWARTRMAEARQSLVPA